MAAKPEVAKEYQSEFGSHAKMIDTEKTTALGEGTDKVVCKDQFGFYETEKWRVDDNMADPNRWDGSRVVKEKVKTKR